MKAHYIYFFQDAKLRVKIGRTADPRRRLRALSGLVGHRLTIIGVMLSDDACAEESAIHRALAEHRIEGEWFDSIVVSKLDPYRTRFLDDLPETDVLIQTWTSPELYDALVARAKSEGRTLANFVRRELDKILGAAE